MVHQYGVAATEKRKTHRRRELDTPGARTRAAPFMRGHVVAACARQNADHARLLRLMRNMEDASAGAAGEAASTPSKPTPRSHVAGSIASAATTDHTAIHAERRDVAAAERRLMVTPPSGFGRLGRRKASLLPCPHSHFAVKIRRAPPQAQWYQNQRGDMAARRDNPARALDPP